MSEQGVARHREVQNPLDRAIYHPLARRLALRLSHTAITPNMVSVSGAVVVMLAALAYLQPGWPLPALVGLFLHMSWHVLDGADGDLARLTGRASSTGEIVDGLCDYVSHLVLYFALALSAQAASGWWVWPLMLATTVSHIFQANFHEVHKRQYLSWAYGEGWLRAAAEPEPGGKLAGFGRAYLTVASWLDPGDERVDAALADPARADAVRASVVAMGPGAFAGSTLLGLNYRTLVIGASMLAGSALWYFAYVVTVLNLLLLFAMWRSRRAIAALVATGQRADSALR